MMLDNTRNGLICEICLILVLTSSFVLIDLKWNFPKRISDFIIFIFIIALLSFYIIRTIRLSIVYRSHIWLKMLHLPSIGMILATGQTAFQDPALLNILIFILFLGLFILLIAISKYHTKFKTYGISIPPARYAALRKVMTKKQRITLVFPDKYIKYLETGDEKYLNR